MSFRLCKLHCLPGPGGHLGGPLKIQSPLSSVSARSRELSDCLASRHLHGTFQLFNLITRIGANILYGVPQSNLSPWVTVINASPETGKKIFRSSSSFIRYSGS